EYTREPQQALVGPGPGADPTRGISVQPADNRVRREGPAAVMRVADEDRMRVADAAVQSHAAQAAEEWAACDAGEWGEFGRQERGGDNTALFVALPVPEEENPVPAHRAAECKAELAPLEERIGIGGIAVERGISRELVVAKEVEGRAVQIVTPGAC